MRPLASARCSRQMAPLLAGLPRCDSGDGQDGRDPGGHPQLGSRAAYRSPRRANASPSVLHEIERAVAYERPVLPVRLDDATPNASLQHYLNLAAQPVAIAYSRDCQGARASLPGGSGQTAKTKQPDLGDRSGRDSPGPAIGLGLGLGLTTTGHQATWTELSPWGPCPLRAVVHSMAYDPSTRKVILFGGATTDRSLTTPGPTILPPTPGPNSSPRVPLPASPLSGTRWPTTRATDRLIMFGGTRRRR